MSINDRKVKKLLKAYYRGEMVKIDIPQSPIEAVVRKKNRIAGVILSFALIAACLLFMASGFETTVVTSPLARQIAVFSKNYEWDKALLNGMDYLKTGYNLRYRED
jgi:hypothetical protein